MSTLGPVAAVNAASSLETGTVQSVAAIKMLKTSLDQQANTAAQLIAAIPQPPQLASSGSVGTQLHAVA
jgi:hypothetical protein